MDCPLAMNNKKRKLDSTDDDVSQKYGRVLMLTRNWDSRLNSILVLERDTLLVHKKGKGEKIKYSLEDVINFAQKYGFLDFGHDDFRI